MASGTGRISRASSTGARPALAWALSLLVVLACFVRFHGLTDKSLWADELFTLNVALHHPLVPAAGKPWYRPVSVLDIHEGDTFLSLKAGEQSPPLFDLLEKASVQALGVSEFSARLPSVLAACALVLWVALAAWRARDPWLRRVLVWTALLLALHPGLIAYAKEARAYSLGASLIGMGMVLWLQRWYRGTSQWTPPGWGEITLLLLASYSHYNAAALVALLLLPDAVLATRRRSRTAWIRLLTLGVVFLAWVALNARTILFTAGGGVAWPRISAAEYLSRVARDLPNMLHAGWLALATALLLGVVITGWLRRSGDSAVAPSTLFGWMLAALLAVFGVLASAIAYKAGMYHPRYYIFAVPVAMLGLGMLCARVHGIWKAGGLAAVVAALSCTPQLAGTALHGQENFREMLTAAAQGADERTLFLYPWKPNVHLYRIYLDQLLGRDSRPQLVGVSGTAEIAQACERLSQSRHVVAVGHAMQTAAVDEVYAACGFHWPSRRREMFGNAVFLEQWHAAP